MHACDRINDLVCIYREREIGAYVIGSSIACMHIYVEIREIETRKVILSNFEVYILRSPCMYVCMYTRSYIYIVQLI